MTPDLLHLSIPLPRPRSQRTRAIARWFGLTDTPPKQPRNHASTIDVDSLLPARGQILLITGASGSGKSSLLRRIREALAREAVVDLNRLRLAALPVVDCFGPIGTLRALGLLGRVGLSEAWTYLRRPDELSEGQRWRLRLALAIHRMQQRPGAVLMADEFAAVLDRITAAVIARALRRAMRWIDGSAIVATSHDDLAAALCPERIVKCDFGRARVTRGP